MATDSSAINTTTDGMTRDPSPSDTSRALAVKSPQYLQLTNKAGTESEYVRDGWSWGGFSFGVFWLIRHRVWSSILLSLVALIGGGLALLASVRYLGNTEFVKSIAALSVAVLLLMHLFLGRRGNFWRQSTLVERGWVPVRKIFAKNVDEAMEVGESALADLPVHRPTPGTSSAKAGANVTGKPELPELRPLLKTGEPEIRTVRRPESASLSTDPATASQRADDSDLSPKAREDAEKDRAWRVANQKLNEKKVSDKAETAAGSDESETVVSDTSSFDAPAPVLQPLSGVSGTENSQDEQEAAPVSDAQDTKTSSIASRMSSGTKTSATSVPQATTAKSTETDQAPVRATPAAAGGDSRLSGGPSPLDEDGNDAATRKRPTFSSTPEAMFERTLNEGRKRKDNGTETDGSADQSDPVRHDNASVNATAPESDSVRNAARKSPASVSSTTGNDDNTDSENSEQERIRLEPTLRPQSVPPHPAPATNSKTPAGQTAVSAENRRKIDNENNELFEVAWNEIESGNMVSALEARALTQHPDNTDQRKALYIRMRVAQLREERLLAREEAAANRRRRAQRIAELEREEVYRDFVQIVQPDNAALRHAKPTLANFSQSNDSDSDLSLKVLNDAVQSMGMTVVFAPMAGYVAECTDGQMLELGNREQLNEFLLVLMNSDGRASTAANATTSNGSGSTPGQHDNRA